MMNHPNVHRGLYKYCLTQPTQFSKLEPETRACQIRTDEALFRPGQFGLGFGMSKLPQFRRVSINRIKKNKPLCCPGHHSDINAVNSVMPIRESTMTERHALAQKSNEDELKTLRYLEHGIVRQHATACNRVMCQGHYYYYYASLFIRVSIVWAHIESFGACRCDLQMYSIVPMPLTSQPDVCTIVRQI